MSESKSLLKQEPQPLNAWLVMGVIFAVIVVRMLLTMLPSFAIDMGGYRSWSLSLARDGFGGFYDKFHVVYGPGYMYLLWLVGKIVTLFGLNDQALEYFIKTVSVISDMVGSFMILLIARKMKKERLGLVLFAAYALNPAIFFNSSVWGQFDSITATMLLVMTYFFLEGYDVVAVIIFTASILTKPQSIFLLPIPAVLYFKNNPFPKNFNWVKFGLAAAGVVVTYITLAMPFADGKPVWWFFEQTLASAKDYPYATANGFNLWTLVGGQTVDDGQPFLGLTYALWGNIMVVMVFALSFWAVIKHKANAFVSYYSAWFIYLAVFLLWTKMHERYMLPAIVFGTICILWDLKLIVPVALASLCSFGNILYIYYKSYTPNIWVAQWDAIAVALAALSMLALVYSLYYYIRYIIIPKKLDARFQ